MVQQLTSKMETCSSLEEILQVSFHHLSQVLGNQNIAVHMKMNKHTDFQPAVMHKRSVFDEDTWKSRHRQIRLDYENDLLFQEAIQGKQSILVPDVELDHRPCHNACRQFGVESMLMLPLFVEDFAIGVIIVVGIGSKFLYTSDQIEQAQTIANTTATCLLKHVR